MIQVNELRIGNWIKEKGRDIYIQVENIPTNNSINCFFAHSDYNDFDLSEFEPIPLTPELLEKCGFKKTQVDGQYINHDRGILKVTIDDRGLVSYQIGEMNFFTAHHLHQLQNLFYCLCGEELEIDMH